MCFFGYVEVCFIFLVKVFVDVKVGVDGEKYVDVELRDDLFVFEICVDLI